MSTNSSKKSFRLIYWGGIPGRGEFIRLTFEYAGYPYTELNSPKSIVELLSNPQNSGHPTHFAPPILELPDGDYISQTANILNYVAPKLGLAGVKGSSMMMARTEAEHEEAEVERAKINQIVSTALDFTNESHDVHHPIAVGLYYEDQVPESKRRAEDFKQERIPKFLNHFNSVVMSNVSAGGDDGYLVGSRTTTADLALFQVIAGLEHAFPKRMESLKKTGRFDAVWKIKERIENSENIAKYLSSDRRQPFGDGLFRSYPELDSN